MRVSAIISVKGTRYYKAAELHRNGVLSPGMAIRLKHQPNNPYDENAVAVLVKKTGAMLGHIPRVHAAKYAALVNSGRIIDARISKIIENSSRLNIYIQVVYEYEDDRMTDKCNSVLWQSASLLPAEPGVYSIRNISDGRLYVGSSINVRSRLYSHVRDLIHGCHANLALQSDFVEYGADGFDAQLLESCVMTSDLGMAEAEHIKSLIDSGKKLYNYTIDGQGSGRQYRENTGTDSVPISDRLAKKRAEEARRRIDAIFDERRKKIINNFDPMLAELLPQTNFWTYYLVTFIGVIIVFVILIPDINDLGVMILSAVISYIVAPLISWHYQKKAKQSARYQELVKQLEEQLASLDKERNKLLNIQKDVE